MSVSAKLLGRAARGVHSGLRGLLSHQNNPSWPPAHSGKEAAASVVLARS
jgi:hypothetical protein